MHAMIPKRYFPFLILVGLIAGELIRWYAIDTRPPAWDQSVHLQLALDYRDALVHGTPVTTPWASVYPPFYHLSLIPALSLGTPSQGTAVATHLVYLLIFLWSLVQITRALQLSTDCALLTALFTLGCSHVLFVLRQALIDFPLIVWVTLGMALLLRTHNFSNRRATVIWGIVSGLGLLLKLPYSFFFILPVLWSLRRGHFKNALWGFGAMMLVCGWWYVWQGPLFLQNALGIAGERGAAEGDPGWNSLAGVLYYLRALPLQMGIGTLVLASLGALLALLRKNVRVHSGLLVLWIFSGYLILTFIHNKDYRYSLPFLPALILVSVMGWNSLNREKILRGLGLAALGLFIWNATHADLPRSEDWKHAELGRLFQQTHDVSQPFILASVLSNHSCLFGRTLRWSLRAEGIPLATCSAGDPLADFTEFVVVKTGDPGPDSQDIIKEWTHLQQSGRAFTVLFQPLARLPLPDGSEAVVYHRDPHPRFAVGKVTASVLEQRLAVVLRRDIKGPLRISIEGRPENLREGRLARIVIQGRTAVFQGFSLPSFTFEVRDAWLNLYRVWDNHTPGLLAFRSAQLTTQIDAHSVESVLRQKVKTLYNLEVHFIDGQLCLSATYKGIPLRATARVELDRRHENLIARVTWLHVLGVPIPGWVFGKIHRQVVPLYPIPSLPGRLDLHEIRLDNDVLTCR